jgi:hypothetical protein
MSMQSRSSVAPVRPVAEFLLDPPDVPAALDDIPGGEPNLLRVDDLDAPLRVEVPMWQNSTPMPDLPERLEVYWNGVKFLEKEWEVPVPPNDLILQVTGLHAQEGTHRIHYRVMTFNMEWADSEVRVITVDRTPPALAGNGGRLQFDVTDVTEEYLEDNGDRLVAQLPAYTSVKPGDEIRWYWDTDFEDDQLVDVRTLTQDDIGKPLELTFPGEMIRERGDGTRMARYRVWDRAGNASAFAGYVNLEVTANQPPRTFPWPDIEDDVGNGQEVTLDPMKALSGATVIIPAAADLRDDDEVWVQWGAKDAPGSYRTQTPLTPGGYEFRIPKEHVAFHIAKTVPVHYEVIDRKGRVYVSPERSVKMGRLTGLQAVQVEGLSGINLSLATVPATGTKLTLPKWPLIGTDQFITIQIDGSDANMQPKSHKAIDQRRLTAAEVTNGIGKDGTVVIPKAFLSGLKLNFQFTVKAFVSFDQGATWPTLPNFPTTSINLIA